MSIHQTQRPHLWFLLFLLVGIGLNPSFLPPTSAQLVNVPELGVRIPPGFRITLYADADLANDIYAMTLDAKGRVVVTSQGWIKTLHDTNNDGRADQATIFATTQTGGMGMCFDGKDLYFVGDGALSVYHDTNNDDVADGPPDKKVPLHFAEHGGHAIRKGPDGGWYLIGGNDTGFNATNHVNLPNSPVRRPEAGALMRLSPNAESTEIIAQGFRNPYDFDFNSMGDLFTYDSDVESDFFLPWYTPTRVYHVGYGSHHGWKLGGWLRSWNKPDYYADVVNILFPVGRGSPTGVVCYRHTQFPEHFRQGLFLLDWTFGKIYYLALTPDGSSYKTDGGLFLEPIGTHGFAPTDIAVAPDGSLFVSIGGRKTRGGVYRIQYAGAEKAALPPLAANLQTTNELDSVLSAPQPLDAWSRARWVPIAQQLGAENIGQAVLNPQLKPEQRVRAIEVVTELFKGLSTDEARVAARDTSPFVRARVAWSLGRAPCANFASVLLPMANDPHPLVRRCALEALADQASAIDSTNLLHVLPLNLAHTDKRVRHAAARLVTLVPDKDFLRLRIAYEKSVPQARLTLALADMWRHPGVPLYTNTLETSLAVLKAVKDNETRLQAVRLLMMALGDWRWNDPSAEAFTAYELDFNFTGYEGMVRRIQTAVRPVFGSGNTYLDGEVARLLAMTEDKDTNIVNQIVSRFTAASYPTADFHYLAVLAKLPASRTPELTGKIAYAILELDRKLEGREQRSMQNWNLRLNEIAARMLERDPALADALLNQPNFARPAHVGLVELLEGKYRERAARLFLSALQTIPKFAWSGALIELMSVLPPAEVRPWFRQQWENFALRGQLVLKLAAKPDPLDRDNFVFGLTSAQLPVAKASLSALQELPRDPSPNKLVPLLRLLKDSLSQTNEMALRTNIVALLERQTGESFGIEEKENSTTALKETYQPCFSWFTKKYPQYRAALESEAPENDPKWNQLLKTVNWKSGNPMRGEALFTQLGCLTCHASTTRLGPDLSGVAARFSAEDLFKTIVYPSRDVAPQFQTTTFKARDGQIFMGIVSFESADGVIVQTGAATTVRLAGHDIISRQPSKLSLMPSGLLNGLPPQSLADLYAYLKALQPKSQTSN